jgi:iron complex outermembrane receptor protein
MSLRFGASYNLSDALTVFANWSQGFMPPSTEELASNPVGFSGFNTHLIPSVSDCFEIGTRGFPGKKLNYELTGFLMNTENDFFRFKQTGRGNQEVFYGNAGNSRRYGIETSASVDILKNLSLRMAYTYADYKYTSAKVDPVYTDVAYVLTLPPEKGQCLPNSPKHQFYCEVEYTVSKNFTIVVGSESQSKWAIYTDSKAYKGELDPDIYQNWQKGFNLLNAGFSYHLNILGLKEDLSFNIRNLTDAAYMAFTEPDPDGNSYHPGPGREFFGKIKISF